MPRKARKSDKAALLFLERPVCGARLQNVPEVRAALNPKDFFSEAQAQDNSALTSWVSPQFDCLVEAAAPIRRGRRKCQSATTILDSCSQLSRKISVCKFPQLSFRTRSRDQSHQPKSTRSNKSTAASFASNAGNQSWGLCQTKRTVSSAQCSDTPKRQSTVSRKRKVESFSDRTATSSKCVDQHENPSIQVTEKCRTPAGGVSTPSSNDFSAGVSPPPDVDTPKVIQDRDSCPSSASLHLLQAQPCTPPCNQPPDILVADTPERDYGLKVTWRRRRDVMLRLKERGHLSDSDVLINS